jgi:hypothetical protein
MTYYVWKYGLHYHQDLNCIMLAGDKYAIFGYEPTTEKEIKKRGLLPCNCVTDHVPSRTVK